MKSLRVSHISASDIEGGAARAAYRIHHALRGHGVDSRLLVNSATAGDWTVEGPQSRIAKAISRVRGPLAGLLTKALRTGNPIVHSPAIVPSHWSQRLNASVADVIHLHWLNSEMMSVSDLGNIKKPVVWTLHDMWAFCGAEHYTEDYRWRDGYAANNRPIYEAGFDLNRWTASRKLKRWKRPMHIVTPSRWLSDCAKQSVLMRDWPLATIPNAIDTNAWRPVDKALARQLLQLPPDVPLLLFGAMGGAQDPRKGFDLLQAALKHLRGQLPGLELVVFGQLAPKTRVDIAFPVHYAGHLHDDVSLRLLYSSADALVIPSRQDNLPNTGVEAHACGTPVVAFDACGLPDIVEHLKTGYLAKAFDPVSLAEGVTWVLDNMARRNNLGKAARDRAVETWSEDVIVPQYRQIYQMAIANALNDR